MTKVKICGISDAVGFDATVQVGADYVGFVFFARSPRNVAAADAARLSARHSGGPKRVGLIVDATDDEIAAILAELPLDILQLHTDAARARHVRARFGLPVWRAVGVSARDDLPHDMDGADALLLDAKAPSGATRPGGNAAVFDWSIPAEWQAPGPWVLAGGLTPGNVAQAVRQTGALCVDVSSGVESAPGRKDASLIRAFVAAARS